MHARPKETAARLAALDDYFADSTLAEVHGQACRAYAAGRPRGAARRELEDPRAAIGGLAADFALAMLRVNTGEYLLGLVAMLALLLRRRILRRARRVRARSIWPFALQSISDWKNRYADVCTECIERPRSAGFFTSGRPKQSRGISPILA
jgi:hypothetical protein